MPEFSYVAGWTDIANQALKTLTEKLINSLNDGTPNANYCRQFLGSAIETALGEGDWGCARARAVLNQLVERPAHTFNYYYQIPGDHIHPTEKGVDTGGEDWEIDGDRLATDATAVNLSYIARPEDPAKLTPAIRDLIAAQLAVRLAIPLAKNEKKKLEIAGEYAAALAIARAAERKARKDQSVTDEQGHVWHDELR